MHQFLEADTFFWQPGTFLSHLAARQERPRDHYLILKENAVKAENYIARAFLSAGEILLKYALDLERHLKIRNLQPSRTMAEQYTTLKQDALRSEGKVAPPPTPAPTPSAKGKAVAVASAIGGAASALCKLIFVPQPNGRTMAMSSRVACMDGDSECMGGEPKPR